MHELAEEILFRNYKYGKKVFAFFSPVGGEGVTYVCQKVVRAIEQQRKIGIVTVGAAEECNGGMEGLLAAAIEHNDLVLVDSSGFLKTPGPISLLTKYEYAFLVIRAGRTRRALVKETMERLKAHELVIAGTILNGTTRIIPNFVYRLFS